MKLATFRPGAESFKRRFPIPPPPIEGTLIGGLRVRRDGGTVYYVFQGLRLPAAATDEVRVWAEEWSYKGWDAALLIAGMVLAVLGASASSGLMSQLPHRAATRGSRPAIRRASGAARAQVAEERVAANPPGLRYLRR